VMRDIQLAASEMGGRLFRNNVGLFQTIDGRMAQCGMGKGSSDLIGFIPAEVENTVLAVFTAIEVKSQMGIPTTEQNNFLEMVRSNGGIAGVVRSRHEFEFLIENSLQNVSSLDMNTD